MQLGTYRSFILLAGDIAVFWISLTATLFLRYGAEGIEKTWGLHVIPFSIVFCVWLLVFYISGLYELRVTGEFTILLKNLFYAMLAGGIIAMALFYFVHALTITPRINLILDVGITTILLTLWRSFFASAIRRSSKVRVLLVGSSPDIEELMTTIETYPQLGYKIVLHVDTPSHHVIELIKTKAVDIVIAPKESQSDTILVSAVYEMLSGGIRFMDASIFYEQLLGKIPVSLISKAWFLENIAEAEKYFFEATKRTLDVLIALTLGVITLPLLPIVALCITIDSRGPIFLRQKRVGKMGKIYTHYKYRTMIALGPDGHAELNGAEWTQKGDARVTRVGSFLRSMRIDELPQLWNIFKGELSFIGPRPERPKFVESLRKEIPFYDMRHLVRPGLSGWAQINPPYYYSSLKDTYLKLQYDLFYIKNRDIGLDIAIMLKTFMVIFSRQGR